MNTDNVVTEYLHTFYITVADYLTTYTCFVCVSFRIITFEYYNITEHQTAPAALITSSSFVI